MSFKKSFERGVKVGYTSSELEESGEDIFVGLNLSDNYWDSLHRGDLSEKSNEFLSEHFMMEGYRFGKELYSQTKSKYKSVYDSIYK